jgi:two-component system LytT family response regulator
MIKCIVVDDEELAQNVLVKYISSIPWLDLVQKFDNSLSAISFLRENKIHLMFLDIRMPELSGLQMLNTMEDPPKVILTTAYSEYALESYNYAVVDYLLKPIEFERFLLAVNKVSKLIHLESESSVQKTEGLAASSLFIAENQNTYKVDLQDINYIKAEGNYLSIKTAGKNYITRETMKEMETRLPGDQFVRVNKSYIVSIQKIVRVYGNTVVIADEEIPIGKVFKMKVLEKLQQL